MFEEKASYVCLRSFILIFICLSVSNISAQETVPGTVLDFDGSNDYVNCSNPANLSFGGTQPFTIEAWVKPNVANADGYIFTKYNKNVNGEYRLGVGGGIPWFQREVAPWSVVGTTNLQANTWYHIAAVYDGSNMLLYVYGEIDGILPGSGAIAATSNDVLIGAQHQSGAPSGFFDGEIEEVRVWNVARNTYQILGNMHLTLSGNEPGLVSYWQFNDSTGTTLSDPINSNNGTLVNMDNSDWIPSNVAVGSGNSHQRYITSPGTYSFVNTGLTMEVTSLSQNQDITVTKIDLAPNISPAYALSDIFDNQYWIVQNIRDGSYTANYIFTPNETITIEDETLPNDIKLFNRAKTSYGSWSYTMDASVADASNNSVNFNSISASNQFMIGRKVEPVVSRFSPTDDSSNVALDANLIITFDRNVTASSGNITIMKSANDSIFETITASSVTITDSLVTINPANDFDLQAEYYVLIDSNAFHDGANNYFAGIQEAVSWNFSALGYFTDIGAELNGIVYSSSSWGDYDNDGDLDILLTGQDALKNTTSKIYNNNAGSFSEVNAMPVSGFSTSAWGDYDNDGDLDVLLTGPMKSTIYRNDGPSAGSGWIFSAIATELPGFFYGSVFWGDYDNDGKIDILIVSDSFSRIYRNDGPSAYFGWTFTDIEAGLPGVSYSSAAWGDYDNDGDLDILLTGSLSEGGYISRIYRNESGVFTDINTKLPGVFMSSVAWGDYDNDGDLDILLTGFETFPNSISRIYRNDHLTGPDHVFTDISAMLPGIISSSIAWGDYDNDGDLDILFTGYTGSILISSIYRNDPSADSGRVFIEISTGLTEINIGSVAWGDYDNDGDLDILLTGSTTFTEPVNPIANIYCNNNLIPNNEPISPDGLNTVVHADSVTFSWDKASDTETPQDGLSYNLFIGNSFFGTLFISPMANLNTGYRSIAAFGNTYQSTSWSYKIPDLYSFPQVLAPNVWGVQAIDHAFSGSVFAFDSLNISADQLQVFSNNVMSLTDSLTWEVVFGDSLTSYQVQIDDDSTFAGCEVNDTLLVTLAGSGYNYSVPLQNFSGVESLVEGIKYYWRIKPNYTFGSSTLFTDPVPSFWFGFITGVEDQQQAGIPKEFALQQNYPNPFNPVTQIQYALPHNARVKIELFDMLGRRLKVLLDEQKPIGFYTLTFEAGNLASGVYMYRIHADNFVSAKKMLLLK